MCGIAGWVDGADGKRRIEAVESMLGALARRGPDGQGVHAWDRAAFGHRRLAIFDLSSAGLQPMVTPDGTLGVVFNGAIYNFGTLRAELERDGAVFRSRTDTEVLLHGYRAWGVDGLVARLRGMFAFALWDASREHLFLVRDRLGVKPLAFARTPDGGLAFASTVRALRAAGVTGELVPESIADVLEYGWVDETHATWAGVQKLPPATILEWANGSTTTRRYWSPPAAGSAGALTFDDAVEETERLLLRAVEWRLQADVPVGALLSGGVDSALVCWAVRKLGGDITAFTVGTPGHAADESAAATATARDIGIPHRVLEMSEIDDQALDELIGAYGEPFAVASALGMLRVSQAVRQSATVLLTGDGGDDVFLGYPRHQWMRSIERAARRTPDAVARGWKGARHFVPKVGIAKRGVHLADYVTGGLGAFLSATPGLPALRRHGVLGERLRDIDVDARRIPWSLASGRNLLDEYLRHDAEHQFVAEYLTKVDGGTMYWALEARSPFLDQELWEFASSLPYELRQHRGELKAVLREILRRRVGERAASERKRGFTIPVESWVRGRWRTTLDGLLADSQLGAEGWIDASAARRLLSSPALDEAMARQLWYVLVAERWLRHERAASVGEPVAGGRRTTSVPTPVTV
ncbi:MAG: asparagine synthase (glutamine-hydrolyzing) [Gemmatirosa sp.]